MKIREAGDQFLNHCRHSKNLSSHTLRAYEGDLKEFIRFTKNQTIESCDRNRLRRYLQHLFEERKLKESSIKLRIACLKAMFRWMEFEEMIESNPFQRMSLSIKLPARLPRGLTTDELKRLLSAPLKQLGCSSLASCGRDTMLQQAKTRFGFNQLTTLVALNILFATGIRVGELISIQLGDIDLTEGVIKIHGKGDRERQVFLPNQQTIRLVKTYIKATGVPTSRVKNSFDCRKH